VEARGGGASCYRQGFRRQNPEDDDHAHRRGTKAARSPLEGSGAYSQRSIELEAGGELMKSVRTRMLIVYTIAAIVVSFFIHWDEMEKGAVDGFNAGWKAG